ncbi:MAG TPA: PIG-L deacetylase family protein [Coxiellaceae bacterium]|nr:PIG-L deacetylase family protein [Coxiellaceae bacterium]
MLKKSTQVKSKDSPGMVKNIKNKFHYWLSRFEKFFWSKKNYKFFIKDWASLPDLQSCADVIKTMRFSNQLTPVQLEGVKAKKILVISPHPDDEIFGAGGVLIKAIQEGAQVKVVYLTSGKTNTQSEREAETLLAAQLIGYETEFFRQPVHAISIENPMLKKFSHLVNTWQPDACFVSALFDDHPDHRRASELLYRAYQSGYLSRNMMIWAYQIYSMIIPNVIVDITDFVELKKKAMHTWATQLKIRNYAHYIIGLNAFNTRFLNTTGTRYAETFFVLPSDEYLKLCQIYFSGKNATVYESSLESREKELIN